MVAVARSQDGSTAGAHPGERAPGPAAVGGGATADRLRWVALVALAGFSIAGQLKQIPPFSWSPVDATILLAAVSLGAAGAFRLVGRRPLRLGPCLGAAAFVLMAVVGGLGTPTGEYPALKLSRLFLVTLVAVVSTVLAVDSDRDLDRLLRALVFFGGIASLSLLVFGEQAYGETGRLISAGGATISFSRSAAFVLLAAVVWFLNSRPMRLVPAVAVLAVIGIEAWIMFAIASRGPLQALAFALVAVLVMLVFRQSLGGWVRFLVLAAIGSGLLAGAWVFSPRESRLRILDFASGDSASARELFWSFTWDELSWTPLGHGWGSWHAAANIGPGFTYPHNIFLEIWFEAGAVGLALFVGVLVGAVWVLFARRRVRPELSVFGVAAIVFWLAAAQVSGDINDNRSLYILMVASLAPLASADRQGSAGRR